MQHSRLLVAACSLSCAALACGTEDRADTSSRMALTPFGPPGAAGASTASAVPMAAPPSVAAAGAGTTSPLPSSSTGMEATAGMPALAPSAAIGSAGADAGASPGTMAAPCPGVPIVPDATGFVALGSNPLGIHGSWFVYSDCNDLGGQNCATVTAPTGAGFSNVGGKMCTSGQTSMSPGAWGAGLGLELNDGPPQMPYDTVAMGVTGFCFTLSGPTIPSTSLRVAFPTRNHQDDPYFSAVTSAGQHTVTFADSAQGSWVTTKSAFEANLVTLLQFQIPSSTTAPVPWDFCVEGLTAIVSDAAP